MAKLICAAITSLDGYVAGEQGIFEWAEPDEEVHAFITALRRSVGTYAYGRRTYETMAGWQTDATLAAQSEVMRDFAHICQAAREDRLRGRPPRMRSVSPPRGPKPWRVNSIFFHCSRQLDRHQLRLPVVPRQLGANPARITPLMRCRLYRRGPDAKANDSESLAGTGRHKHQ
jgi:hypothetical protein